MKKRATVERAGHVTAAAAFEDMMNDYRATPDGQAARLALHRAWAWHLAEISAAVWMIESGQG